MVVLVYFVGILRRTATNAGKRIRDDLGQVVSF